MHSLTFKGLILYQIAIRLVRYFVSQLLILSMWHVGGMGLLLLALLPGPHKMFAFFRCVPKIGAAEWQITISSNMASAERRIIPPRNRIWGVTRPALVFCVVNPILFILPTTIVFLHIVLQPLVEFGDAQEKMYHWVH